MNPNCRVYALPSLCYSILPTCRMPEITNYMYATLKVYHDSLAFAKSNNERSRKNFEKKNARKKNSNKTTNSPITTTTPLTITSNSNRFKRNTPIFRHYYLLNSSIEKLSYLPYPPSRATENVRRICRNECELLEHELCQKEYAIAKRHPTIGHKLQLEDCENLPDDSDCMPLGIEIDVHPDETCYWENGASYRGTMDRSASGFLCAKWAKLMKEIADYPELAGQNYCRYILKNFNNLI